MPRSHLTAADRPVRVALVTNIPAPYRVPVFNLLARDEDIELTVFYAARIEPDRRWDLPPLQHKHVYLEGEMFVRGTRFIHYNPRLWGELLLLQPDVVVTTGYNPTHLLGFVYAMLYGCAHVPMTDGTVDSERGLSWAHRALRRLVVGRSRAGIVASHGGWRLLRHHGMQAQQLHFSPLGANSSVTWGANAAEQRDIDLLFSGRLVAMKNPGFALAVASGVGQRLGRRVRLAMLGEGALRADLQAEAQARSSHVEVLFNGHLSQAAMPEWFGRSRLFLFPTLWDPWGVVASEACLAGTPVLASPHAGAVGELVRERFSGRVLPLQLDLWVDAATEILTQPALLSRLSAGAREAVQPYSDQNAAVGIADAALQAARSADSLPPPRRSHFVRRPRVVCVQRRLPHYRVALFEQLRDQLDRRGIEFVLVHGEPTPAEQSKNDSGRLPWAVHSPCHYRLNGRVVWQDPRPAVTGADLVIVTQENRQLYNLLAMTVQRPARLAYWGHGRDFQTRRPDSPQECFKRLVIKSVDWWFAYTEISAELVRRRGFASERITTLNNSLDTESLAAECASINEAEVQAWKASLGLGGGPVALFMGSLYPDKRIDFLLAAATELQRRLPGLQLLVAGSGPLAPQVADAANKQPWIHPLGLSKGRDKALCLRAASLLLNPGLVGLCILDSFVAGLPMVTTDCGLHSPEIAYLRHGENGLMTTDSAADFVHACEQLLRDPLAHARLAAGARADADRYTMQNMTTRFIDGIEAVLELPPRR